MEILRKYGVETTFYFPLVDAGALDFEATPVTHASGDTQVSKDGGAFANTTNAFAHEGNGIYSLTLTATEMQAALIQITVVDSATKAWEDQAILIATYGNASAQHAFDLDTASTAQTGDSYARIGAPAGASLSADVAAIAADQTPKKNTALTDIPIYLVSSTDHVTPVTGITPTVEISQDGGAFAAMDGSSAIAEVSDGLYQLDLAAADMNADTVVIKVTGTGADPALLTISTVD